MNLGTLRGILRRQLNELTPYLWSNAELNEQINIALQEWQLLILGVNPEAFIYVDTADVVSGQAIYSKPIGMFFEKELARLSDDNVTYTPMVKHGNVVTSNPTRARTALIYSHEGRWFRLSPTPSVNQTAGLRVKYVPLLTVTDDTDVPAIHIALHTGIVLQAKINILEETGEDSTSAERKLAQKIEKIPFLYGLSDVQEPGAFDPGLRKS